MRRWPGLVCFFLMAATAAFAQVEDVVEEPPASGEAFVQEALTEESPTGTVQAASADDLALEAYVDGLIATWQAVHGAPGYTVAVVRPDRVVLSKGYGLADVAEGMPVDPETTRFYIASISKTFIWTSLMILVERGILDLSEDVNAYLKRYTVPEGERPLTLGDLMDHRAGVEENLDLFSSRIAAMDLPEAIAASEPRQVFPRGERAAYSNWGSNLAALVIEDSTGQSYADFLFAEILQPLGMTTTTLTDQSPAAANPATPVSKNYRVASGGPEEVGQLDLGSFAPIGGMTTTAADMARWLRFHLNQGELDGLRLLTRGSYGEMRRRQFDPVPDAPGRAHGFFDLPYRSTSYYGHTGSINAFYSKFAVAPELGLGVFIAQNTSDDFDPLSFVPRLVMDRELALRGEFDPAASRPEPTAADFDEAESLAGRYMSSRRIFHGPQKVISASMGPMELKASDGYLVINRDNAPFVRIGDDLWENRFGERLAFVRDADGEVARVITPGGAVDMEPVTLLTDPRILLYALGATVLFALTTLLGLWRRFGQQRENRAMGHVFSWIALLGIVPLIWLAGLAARMPKPGEMAFAEAFTDWPLPIFSEMILAATIITGTAAFMVLCLPLVWPLSGWNGWRKLHFTLFALAYAALGLSFVNWGLVPYLA